MVKQWTSFLYFTHETVAKGRYELLKKFYFTLRVVTLFSLNSLVYFEWLILNSGVSFFFFFFQSACHIHTNLVAVSWSCPKLRRVEEPGPHCWKNSRHFLKLKYEVWENALAGLMLLLMLCYQILVLSLKTKTLITSIRVMLRKLGFGLTIACTIKVI